MEGEFKNYEEINCKLHKKNDKKIISISIITNKKRL